MNKQSGFTLVELLIALMVSSIILSAVATLAYATTAASTATDDIGREQAILQHIHIRLTDLIRRANSVYFATEFEFWVWHDENADGWASFDECTRIAKGVDGNTLTIGYTESYSQCQNITFSYDTSAPDTEFVAIWFDLEENGQTQRYTVNVKIRSSDEHRLF